MIPMHCSGLNFVQEATAQMGDKVLVTTTGSRLTFGIDAARACGLASRPVAGARAGACGATRRRARRRRSWTS